jgi:beta-N-acetylhexosaminidase
MGARTRVVFGCAGTELSANERAFFTDARPWGFILFARNFDNPGQARRLVSSLRETVDDSNAPVLIDQEGGRVQRLKPPHWKARPAALCFGELYEKDAELAREAVYLNARLIAHDLASLGITVNCAPVLDVPVEGASNVIGDRAFGHDPTTIIDLGRAAIEGYLDGGVLPVMKHAPGHGRATADSHFDLPHVAAPANELSATDFVPFRALAADCPCAMSAHVVYEAIDSNRPGTTSPRIILQVIRGEIGFDGLLFTDDLSMNALSGSLASRTEKALFAGCDIICHCNGKMDEMKDVASEVKPLEGDSLRRAGKALSHLHAPGDLDLAAAEARVAELLGTPL